MRILALALALAAFSVAATADQLTTLTVKVENVSIRGGKLHVGVYDAESFTAGAFNPVLSKVTNANPGTMVVTFIGIAPGTYAVKVVQDVNANSVQDKRFLGQTSEPIGYSNAVTHNGQPSFQEAKFAVTEGDNKIVIRLHE